MKTLKAIDECTITLPRYVEPKDDVRILLGQLGRGLPVHPPPKVSTEGAKTVSRGV